MKITVEYKNDFKELPKIEWAKVLGDYSISVKFSDGKKRNVDFKKFLEKSFNPAIKSYLNKRKFKQFQIIDGNLNWNNYDLIFPIEDIYRGRII
jgi:hypothetical protein